MSIDVVSNPVSVVVEVEGGTLEISAGSGPNLTVSPAQSAVDAVEAVTHADPTSDTVTVTVASPGPQGPPGQDAAGAIPPLVVPVTAVSSKTITHEFPYPPDVKLIDADGEQVWISVDYLDSTHVYIQFPAPFTGTITLS